MSVLPPPRVVGHRGAAALAPENTLAGFRSARGAGVRWIEFDVQATRDGHPVLMHDARLERTTDGYGLLAARSLVEIERLDAGRWFGRAFAGERVPRLEAALACLDELDMGGVVEIKAVPGAGPGIVLAAAAALGAHDPSRLILSSFDEAALALAATELPAIPRALLVKTVPPDWRARLDRLGGSALHIGDRGLDAATLGSVARRVSCRVYTVNAAARARDLRAWGAEGVFTDSPDVIVSGLGHEAEGLAMGLPAGETRT